MWKRRAETLLGLLVLMVLSVVTSARALGWKPILLPPREWGFTKTERALVLPKNLVVVEVVRVGCLGLEQRTVYSEKVRELWGTRGRRKHP